MTLYEDCEKDELNYSSWNPANPFATMIIMALSCVIYAWFLISFYMSKLNKSKGGIKFTLILYCFPLAIRFVIGILVWSLNDKNDTVH